MLNSAWRCGLDLTLIISLLPSFTKPVQTALTEAGFTLADVDKVLNQISDSEIKKKQLITNFNCIDLGYSLWWSESPDFGKRPKKPCPKVKYRQVWQPMRLSHWYAVTKLQLWGNHRIPPLILKMLLFLSSVIPYLSR